jgi:hypothetical protein
MQLGSGAKGKFKQQILNNKVKVFELETNFVKVYFSVPERNPRRCFSKNTEAF